MNKLFLTMLAVLLIVGGAHAQTTGGDSDQTSFPDVPENSYAADAVAELADLGIVIGFPDGTFRGNDSFTRYQAALVVTRLIDVLESEFVTEDDLNSLRNAVQEIASDIAALEAAISSGMGADPEALQDLQNQLEALRQLEASVAQNTRAIDALNDLVALLNEEIVGLQTGGDIDPSFLEDIERNTGDIANIREFVILLRRDQVALRDQVAALEESDAQQNERLDGLEERVSTLEDQAITFNGSLSIDYEVGRLGPDDVAFDVDRVFGIGLERERDASIFSSGTEDYNDDDDEGDDGEKAQDRQDIENEKGDIDPDFDVTIGFSSERGLRGAFTDFEAAVTLGLKEVTVLDGDVGINDDDDEDGTNNLADPDEYTTGYVFSFDDIDLTFAPIGAEPLIFTYGEEPDADFTPYVFESLGPGFVARLGTPDVLAFLQPELTIAYGVYDQGGDDDDNTVELPDDGEDAFSDGTPNPFTDAYYRAIRGTLSPLEGVSGGFSVAQISGNAAEYQDQGDDNASVVVYGADGEVNISILTVTAEFAVNQIDDDVVFQDSDEVAQLEDTNEDGVINDDDDGDTAPVALAPGTVDDETLFYVQAEVDTSDIPLLESLEANYRSIPQYWYGLKYDEDDYVYDLNQTGFGAKAGLGVFIFNLDAYIDSYTIEGTETAIAEDGGAEVTGDSVLAFGVDVGVEVFRAIEPFGFFQVAQLEGTQVEDLGDAERDDSELDDGEYFTGYGVGLKHDGDADNALVPGLNFEITYDFTEESLSEGALRAEADTEISYAGFTIDPYLEYDSDFSAEALSDDTVTIQAGTGLSSEPLDIFLAPSIAGNVNYRTTDHTDASGDEDDTDTTGEDDAIGDFTSTELQFSVGVVLNEFLFENSVLGARYGYYQGVNVQNETNSGDSTDDNATDISDGDEFNSLTQTTSGFEVDWTYYGLTFAYGLYTNDRGGQENNGQAFTIAYELNF